MKNFLSAEDPVERMKTQAKLAGNNYKPPRLVPRTYKELSMQMIQLGTGHKTWAGCSLRGHADGRHTQEKLFHSVIREGNANWSHEAVSPQTYCPAKLKNGHKPNALKVLEPLDLSRLLVDWKTVQPFWNRAWRRFLIELNLCTWDDLVTALLGVYPREVKTGFTQNPAHGCS